MKSFLLLLHEPVDALPDITPDDMQRIIERYNAWSNDLAEKGRLEGGSKLVDGEGRVLVANDDDLMVTDGPYAEAKEVIGGIFRILADDYDDAIALSRTCPHLDFGKIEIREIDPV
ncbi:MAG: YciI family protein [Acidobacteriota bacterium]